MAYTIQTPLAGLQPIAVTNTTASSPLGYRVTAVDPTYGQGEFVYLLGVASTAIGSIVTWNGNSTGTPTFQTALTSNTAGQARPIAVAMSANLGGSYGWYQVVGNAVAGTNGTLAAGPAAVYLAAAGVLTSTQAAGTQVLGAINVTATGTPAANLAVVEINNPHAQGQIV
ncbi:MAG: hypothetical protein NTW48_10120 [Chloroflexi bacterium]|nr:hypothetical protein [Chloroflexota bacterium]